MFPLPRWNKDRWLAPPLALLAALAVVVLALILAFLLWEARPALAEQGAAFLTHHAWYPLEGYYGMLPMLWASLLAAVGALLLSAPLGLALAILIAFHLHGWAARALRGALALLAGLPSVAIGLWGLTVLVPLIGRWQAPGASLLAAMVVLALMILPTLALIAAAALGAVSPHWLRAAAASGLSRRAAILRIALPAARSGLIAAALLGLARALGETMAVLMVAGNVVQMPASLFDPVRTLTANIALEMAYAMDEHRAALYLSGWLLTLLVAALVLLTRSLNRGGDRAQPVA